MLNQELKNAGYFKNGQLHQFVIKAPTKELEKARVVDLGVRLTDQIQMEKEDFERWAWGAWNRTSAVFLHSPPDQFGFMEEPTFQHGFTTYLGQPCPLIAPLVGMYF